VSWPISISSEFGQPYCSRPWRHFYNAFRVVSSLPVLVICFHGQKILVFGVGGVGGGHSVLTKEWRGLLRRRAALTIAMLVPAYFDYCTGVSRGMIAHRSFASPIADFVRVRRAVVCRRAVSPHSREPHCFDDAMAIRRVVVVRRSRS